jgi:hypothetical protein
VDTTGLWHSTLLILKANCVKDSLLEEISAPLSVKKFSAIYGTRRFSTVVIWRQENAENEIASLMLFCWNKECDWGKHALRSSKSRRKVHHEKLEDNGIGGFKFTNFYSLWPSNILPSIHVNVFSVTSFHYVFPHISCVQFLCQSYNIFLDIWTCSFPTFKVHKSAFP